MALRKKLRKKRGYLLSAALLLASPAWAADNPILLQADQMVYDGDTQSVSAVGHVEIADQGRILHADRVVYDQSTDKVTARGHVSVTDTHGNVAFADQVVLTDRMRDGALSGFGALIGKTGRMAAARAERVQDRIVIAHNTIYSPCKICNKPGQRTPLWQVKAERVVYDQEKHRIHFNNATVELAGVPIIYTPFLSQPDPTVKFASGLLAPDAGNSTRIGYFVRMPVYLALSDTNDLTLAPQFSTKGGELLQVEYRARWDNGGFWLQGSGAHNANGGLGGGAGAQWYDHLFGSGRFGITEHWRVGFDAALTNNSAYMRYYDISYLDRLTNDLFIEHNSGRSRVALTGYYFQGLRSTDSVGRIPVVLPFLEFNYIPNEDVLGGQFRFDLNGAAISRGNGRNDQRAIAEMRWQNPVVMNDGQIWTFVLDARGDSYHVDTPLTATTAQSSRFFQRGTAYAELDWRWPFIASAGPRRTYLVEPIVQAIAQPRGGNPVGIRNEDSRAFEFDENNLFSVNQLPGYDLIESGPRANVGFKAQAFFPTGQATAVIGQTYRLKPDPIFGAASGQTGNSSDVVGEFSLKFPHINLTQRLDLDRGNGTLRRHEIYLTGSYARSSVQVSYVELPTDLVTLGLARREEINAQADINFYQNWQGFVAIRRDLQTSRFLDTEYGLGYEDECLAISLAYRRKYTFDTLLGVPPSTSVVLRFSLKTGDQPVQPFSLFPRNVFSSSNHL